VKAHVTALPPQASSLLIARPTSGAGARSIVRGQHAFDPAEELARQINKEHHGTGLLLHLFIAAPNAFTFFFGQRQPRFGRAS
jgi:SMODS-associated and fused to various effectors sensor domain